VCSRHKAFTCRRSGVSNLQVVSIEIDTGVMLSRVHTLPSGVRVRLRLVQRRDEQAIRRLLAAGGLELDDIEVMRLVRFDPCARVVICATALIGFSDAVVGVAAGDRAPGAVPDLLVVDFAAGEGLDQLLAGALRARAHAIAPSRAA
jgi:hypothetical protein